MSLSTRADTSGLSSGVMRTVASNLSSASSVSLSSPWSSVGLKNCPSSSACWRAACHRSIVVSFCVFVLLVFLDCRCFPADFHLGLHPAAGLSLEYGAFLPPDYLPCIENRSKHPGAPVGEAVTTPPVVGLCGTVSNPTLHLGV